MNRTMITYLLSLAVSLAFTAWVARTLSRNGRALLVGVFQGEEGLADAVNRLLVVDFYLINLGYVSLLLRLGSNVMALRESIEALSWKGCLVLIFNR